MPETNIDQPHPTDEAVAFSDDEPSFAVLEKTYADAESRLKEAEAAMFLDAESLSAQSAAALEQANTDYEAAMWQRPARGDLDFSIADFLDIDSIDEADRETITRILEREPLATAAALEKEQAENELEPYVQEKKETLISLRAELDDRIDYQALAHAIHSSPREAVGVLGYFRQLAQTEDFWRTATTLPYSSLRTYETLINAASSELEANGLLQESPSPDTAEAVESGGEQLSDSDVLAWKKEHDALQLAYRENDLPTLPEEVQKLRRLGTTIDNLDFLNDDGEYAIEGIPPKNVVSLKFV